MLGSVGYSAKDFDGFTQEEVRRIREAKEVISRALAQNCSETMEHDLTEALRALNNLSSPLDEALQG